MDTIALRLDPQTRLKLEILAHATGVSRAAIVSEAVCRFVDAELEALGILHEDHEMTLEQDGMDKNVLGLKITV